MSHTAYHSLVCAAHVVLDPFPFGGGVTFSDSLTCPRTRARSKASTNTKANTGTRASANTRASTGTRARALTPPSFVTAPALQTVHALGHGLATALSLAQRDQNQHQKDLQVDNPVKLNDQDKRTLHRTPRILPISIPGFRHDVIRYNDTYVMTATCVQSNLSSPVKSSSQISQSNLTSPVMEMIDAYARAAVQLAQQTWEQRQNHDSKYYHRNTNNKNDLDTTPASRKNHRKQSELDNVLYDINDEVVHEWKSFLLRIWY